MSSGGRASAISIGRRAGARHKHGDIPLSLYARLSRSVGSESCTTPASQVSEGGRRYPKTHKRAGSCVKNQEEVETFGRP